MTDDDAESFVLVVCPTCRARLHPRRQLIGKRVRCPECGVPVRVEEQRSWTEATKRQERGPGEYQLSDTDQPSAHMPTVQVTCGTCGTRLTPRADLVGKRVRCPDCFQPVLVTAPRPEQAEKKRPPARPYGVGIEPAPAPVPETTFLQVQGILEPESAPEPPRNWFFSGVFSFPWSPGTHSHWLSLSLFALFANGIAVIVLYSLPTLSGEHNIGTAILVPFLIGLGGIIWGLMMAYMAGCVLSVIRDTASGNEEVVDWGDTLIYEAIGKSFYLWIPALSAAAMAYGVFRLVDLAEPRWAAWSALAGALILFPIMFLSAVEAGSPLAIFSADALRLIFGYFHGWLLVNLVGGLLAGGWLWLTQWGLPHSRVLTVIIGAPSMSAIVFINARLMGRFLQRAAEAIEERQQRREQEEEEVETMNDER